MSLTVCTSRLARCGHRGLGSAVHRGHAVRRHAGLCPRRVSSRAASSTHRAAECARAGCPESRRYAPAATPPPGHRAPAPRARRRRRRLSLLASRQARQQGGGAHRCRKLASFHPRAPYLSEPHLARLSRPAGNVLWLRCFGAGCSHRDAAPQFSYTLLDGSKSRTARPSAARCAGQLLGHQLRRPASRRCRRSSPPQQIQPPAATTRWRWP